MAFAKECHTDQWNRMEPRNTPTQIVNTVDKGIKAIQESLSTNGEEQLNIYMQK